MVLVRSILALLLLVWAGSAYAQQHILVFAAASMKEALEAAGEDFELQTGSKVRFSFTASSVAARQIAAGAPADVFVSADEQWVEWLKENAAVSGEPKVVAGNSLVLVAAEAETATSIDEAFSKLSNRQRLALGDPAHVPAGRYAKMALKERGDWERVKGYLVQSASVRVALAYVTRGEAPFGIVYGSDLSASTKVRKIATFDVLDGKIVYPALNVSRGKQELANSFVSFLLSSKGQQSLQRFGFSAPED